MTAEMVSTPPVPHRCLYPPIRADGTLDLDHYRWHVPGTVLRCKCGQTWVAEKRAAQGESGVWWRVERRRERRRRERKAAS